MGAGVTATTSAPLLVLHMYVGKQVQHHDREVL